MKKIVILFLLTSSAFFAFSQKAIPYVPMYVPQSTGQMWNEIVMANTVVDQAIKDAKINFTIGRYYHAIENSNNALYFSKNHLSSINTEIYYILGRSYQKLGKEGKSKKYLKKAKKYGITSDSQVFK